MAIFDKFNDAIETSKLNSKIHSEKNAIGAAMEQIGEFYYNRYLEAKTADEGVKGFCAEIDAHNAAIAEAKADIERIKAKDAAAHAPAGGAVCPACGAEVAPGF